jgi:hypothetical protein
MGDRPQRSPATARPSWSIRRPAAVAGAAGPALGPFADDRQAGGAPSGRRSPWTPQLSIELRLGVTLRFSVRFGFVQRRAVVVASSASQAKICGSERKLIPDEPLGLVW